MRHPPAKRNGSVGHHPTAAATTQTYPPTTTLVLAGAPTNALDVPQNTPPALVRIDVRCGRRCGWTFPTFLRSDEPDMADANAAPARHRPGRRVHAPTRGRLPPILGQRLLSA